jgi:hypothetical protein
MYLFYLSIIIPKLLNSNFKIKFKINSQIFSKVFNNLSTISFLPLFINCGYVDTLFNYTHEIIPILVFIILGYF